jgi:hypothetical protein
MKRAARTTLVTLALAAPAPAQPPGVAEWRSAHERAILDELTTLVGRSWPC